MCKKFLLIFVIFLPIIFVLPNNAIAAVAAYDNSANAFCDNSGNSCANGTTLTYPLTVGNNSNRQLAVFAFIGCNSGETAPAVSSVSYAGVSLNQTVSVNPNASRRGYLYTLPAGTQPNTGTNNVVVTLASSLGGCNLGFADRLTSGAVSVYNVDQTTVYASTPLSNSGSSASAILTGFTSGANDLGISSICAGNGITNTTETSRWTSTDTNNSCNSNAGATASGGDTSFSWTIPSDSWIIIGGAFKGASLAPDTQSPTTPANLSATAISSSQINLSWTASTDDTAVTGYRIYRNGSLLTTVNSPLTTFSDTGLSPSTLYSYTVSAYDAANNNSNQSTSASATTQSPPIISPTLTVSYVSAAAGTNVDLPVALNSSTAGVSGLQFDLILPSALTHVSTAAGSSSSAAGKQAVTSIVGGNLRVLIFGFNTTVISPGEVAVVKLNVAAGTAAGMLSIPITGVVFTDAGGIPISGGTNTNGSVTVTPPPDTTAPSVPTNLSATAISSSAINLSWTASTDAVGVTGYKIYRAGTQIGTSATNSYSDTGLTPSTTYSYTVSAYDVAGNNSSQSTSASATTQAPPPQGTYPWSNIIAPERATDWSKAGAIIVNRTTQCGATIAAYTGSAATINNAIANCPSGQYVQLGAGTFILSSGINISRSDVTLRGMGASQTKLKINGQSSQCGFFYTPSFSVCSPTSSGHSGNTNGGGPGPDNSTTWTAGYAQGTTAITLGAHTNLTVGAMISLDQLNDASDGYPATGDLYVCDNAQPCSWEGGGSYYRPSRAQLEQHKIIACGTNTPGAACTSNTIILDSPIMTPNFRASQSPGAWWGNPGVTIENVGVENLAIDFTDVNAPPYGEVGVIITNAMNCWFKGISLINSGAAGSFLMHFTPIIGLRITLRDSYIYGSAGPSGITNYGVMPMNVSQTLYENNILHHNITPFAPDDPETGSVYGYNYIDDAYYSPGPQPHNSGDLMNLWEGNNTGSIFSDSIHGTHFFLTFFRNHFDGTTHNTSGVTSYGGLILWSHNRFHNVIGNVFGSSAYTSYETNMADSFNSVFGLGFQGSHGGTALGNDSNVKRTLLRWGNWDNVNNATRWLASEIPSTITNYSNPVPANQSLPASFYLSGQPSWWTTPWGTPKWPAIGPDVSSGNVTNSPTGGHADKIPARLCFENTGNDPAYPSSNPRIKLFNASSCYGTSGGSGDATPPSVPTNLSATAVSTSAINLNWTASTDSVGVTGYRIYRGGVQIGTSVSNSYSDTNLSASTLYSYTVSAYDAAGNTSSQSSSVSATTQSGQPVPGDLNSDHIVNALDYSLLNSKWLQNFSAYDLFVDGLINSLDFAILSSNWGKVW